VADEERQEPELRWRQTQLRPASTGVAGRLVNHQVADPQGPFQPPPAAQDDPHPGQQLLQGERLGQVVVGADREPLQPVADAVAGGHEDNRHIPTGQDLAGEVETVPVRQDHVDHQKIRSLSQHPVGADMVVKHYRAEPLGAKRSGDRVANKPLVLDDDHTGRAGGAHRPPA